MCGIFGIVGDFDKSFILNMAEILRHRGPDDSGFFFGDRIALGNTRLSIIDIKSGHQPIHNEDSTIWITHNGEIYNFQQLRPALEKLGHRFYTNSDTEVIVHAYEEWGEDCVREFNGMWAFAIWDSNRKHLFLSRDRLGIKPLYYSNGRRFTFASEIKAILLDESIPKIPNDKMIYDYLVHGLVDHTEQTFFDRVQRLLPAHNLLFSDKNVRQKKYWNMPCLNNRIENCEAKDGIYAAKFLELFEDSVRLQLISEVPIGTCLSGGLDSSSIVCMINHLLGHGTSTRAQATMSVENRQKTFTACFNDRDLDEREYVEEVIAQTNAESNLVYPNSKQLWKDIEKIVYSQEEPFTGSSVYAQWCVMKLAGQKVRVVLDGQGGDELLTGYIAYHFVLMRDLWKKGKIVDLIRELATSFDIVASHIPHYISILLSKPLKNMKALLNDDFVSRFASETEERALMTYADLSDLMYTHTTRHNLPALLRYEDKNSMAFSVEARVPFLDHRLVEYTCSLPITQKLRSGWTKRILRNSMVSLLPEKIRKRRRKIAFATPQATWLNELEEEMREVFTSPQFRMREYFNQPQIMKKLDEFSRGKSRNYNEILWRILNLELWLRLFIDDKTNMKNS